MFDQQGFFSPLSKIGISYKVTKDGSFYNCRLLFFIRLMESYEDFGVKLLLNFFT